MFFSKPARDPAFVAWHQDATFWGLSKPSIVTAWLAFTPSTTESGCLQVVPGTHHRDQVPHRTASAAANMLSRNQELAVEIDKKDIVNVVLAPGEMSIHHVKLFHGSEPNRADHPRIGYAMRFIAADVRQLTTFRDSATLVAGRDQGNFDLEPAPKSELDADALAFHDQMLNRQAEIQAAI
jgi:ectoine hydroxylase-related dioxygenase (phytanoyl-CoA dioxygenase family)